MLLNAPKHRTIHIFSSCLIGEVLLARRLLLDAFPYACAWLTKFLKNFDQNSKR